MKIQDASPQTVSGLWQHVQRGIVAAPCLEQAAQVLATALHNDFAESVVIARLFLTVPFASLPDKNAEFVRKLAQSAGAASHLKDSTPVLSLVGTHGAESDWCDRRKSKGHTGIPLISSAFVGGIPMISRLLRELGLPLDWTDSHDAGVVVETLGGTAGLFFVQDAASSMDHEGRKIIVAQDFVSSYRVQTVFGVAGAYPGGQILVVVVFCRDALPRVVAERFPALSSWFTGATASLLSSGRIFSAA